MSAKPLKQMVRDGEVKRADAMKVRLADLREEPGFNLRREGEDLSASIDALADHIASGGLFDAADTLTRSLPEAVHEAMDGVMSGAVTADDTVPVPAGLLLKLCVATEEAKQAQRGVKIEKPPDLPW